MKLHYRADGFVESKYALEKVMKPYLPEEIIYRRKQGFHLRVRSWPSGPFLDALQERLLSGHNYTSMLMALLALETWADVYSRRVGAISWR